MANRPPTTTAARRRWVLAAAVVGWIVIVVAGAGDATNDSLLGVDNLDVVWIIVLGVMVLLSLAFFIYLNPFANEWTPPEKKRRSLGIWLMLGVLALLWVWRPNFLQNLAEENPLEALGGALAPEDLDTSLDDEAPETVAQASDLLLIALGVSLLGGLWYFLRWRSRQGIAEDVGPSTLALEADLRKALDEASNELAVTGDPRTAVLRSYAVLETVLATHGLARGEAETSTEHMRRSLRNLRVESAPLIELGALYELARFSEHPITAAQQGDAAEALARARASLVEQV